MNLNILLFASVIQDADFRTFFAVIALLVTTSTIYDVYLQKLSKGVY